MLLFLPEGCNDLVDQAQLLLSRFLPVSIRDLGELLLQEPRDILGECLRGQCLFELAAITVLPGIILYGVLQPPVNDLLVDAGNQTFLLHPNLPCDG